jgi:CheY-like chemotaxis protein/ribosomal protein S27E
MVLVCSGCKNQITLEEASVPEGVFKVRCTGCGKIITAQRTSHASQSPPIIERSKPVAPAMESGATISPAIESFLKKEIANAKKEILDAMQSLFTGSGFATNQDSETGISQRALVCSGDPVLSQSLSQAAQSMGYSTDVTVSAVDSLKASDTSYAMFLIDPSFSDDLDAGKKIIGKINARKAVDRRKIFVVLISSSQKTQDGNAAFMSGVNLIVNKSDLNALVASIRQTQKDLQQMYSAYNVVTAERGH